MSDRRIAKDLDDALKGAEPTDEVETLVEVAARLEERLDVDAPAAGRERALFTSGVGLRRKGLNPLRVVIPALAVVGLVAIIAFVGGRALPGETLYPVREALDSVGLANLPEEEFEDHIDDADRLLTQSADALGNDELGRAESLAVRAMIELEAARVLIEELNRSNRDEAAAEVDRLRGEARTLITTAALAIEGAGDEDDSSGPGSGDEDDNSGPGSGDADDSSGPGSGDEDDNSGPGSGDADDSSGPGSGDEDDSSGPGSGDGSGSGGEDSGGPGSG